MDVAPQTEQIILALRASGLSLREIEAHAEVHAGRKAISRIINRHGGKSAAPASVWADDLGAERVAFLKAAWADKEKYPSVTKIAQAMTRQFGRKIDKSSVIGKAHRLNLDPRGESIAPRASYQNGFAKSQAPAVQEIRAASLGLQA